MTRRRTIVRRRVFVAIVFLAITFIYWMRYSPTSFTKSWIDQPGSRASCCIAGNLSWCERLNDWSVAGRGRVRPPADHVIYGFLAGIPRAEIIQCRAVAELNAHLDVDPVDARVQSTPGFYDEPVFRGPDLQCVSSVWLLKQATFSPGRAGSRSPAMVERLGQVQATARTPNSFGHPASPEELPLS